MKSVLFSVALFLLTVTFSYAQVGIGTTDPKAFLHVPAGRTVLFGNDTAGVNSSSLSVYPKLIWYSSKGAFRAGGVSGGGTTYFLWDNANVGNYSFASGIDTRASGYVATSMGFSTTATGSYATAMGNQTRASGESATSLGINTVAAGKGATVMGEASVASGAYATAMGFSAVAGQYASISMGSVTTASASYAIAMGSSTLAKGTAAMATGDHTTASGNYSTSMGYFTSADGSAATAMGFQTTANGGASTSMGFTTSATGNYSTSMGAYVSTNGMTGSFIAGDWNPTFYNNSAANQLMMRYSGGYVLYSSSPTSQSTALGVELAPNSNAWSTLSDSTRKENFRKADGASFLQKIATMRLGSWNYKGQDAHKYRHYGPMAQDFFAAFGQDELGTIGEDKSINQADFDGVNLIAIQALVKEVNQLKAENQLLRAELKATSSLRSDIEAIKQQLSSQASVSIKPQ